MRWTIALALFCVGCAQAPGTVTVTCAAQDLSNVKGNAAASCATITIMGNTPTATATTTLTIPSSAAGGGLGGLALPAVAGALAMGKP